MKRFYLTTAFCAHCRLNCAHAQFGSGIVYDPTQSAHAIEQISQGSRFSPTR